MKDFCTICDVPICPICKSHELAEGSRFCRYHDKMIQYGPRYQLGVKKFAEVFMVDNDPPSPPR